ncbi:MAG: ORF6N domain-containing protein [Clostridium sp.]|uniref:ORF6N domain-containing protein n=1 Tax=Clostridium sp. TaxID=1506 RepID=UPI003D6C9AEB
MNLLKVEHKNQRVLTTEQLALGYGASERNINDNFNNHKDRFIEGKHYFLLQGDKLRCFKNYTDNIGVVGKRAPSLYLWTERGALRHAKILDTDKAWEVYEMLEETYYREAIEINPGAEWRKKTNLIISKICRGLNNYRTPKDDIYNALEERAKCKLKTRLNNLKVRALGQGMHAYFIIQVLNIFK